MSLQSVVGKVVLAIWLVASLTGAAHAAPEKPSPDTPVLVAEDKSSGSNCLMQAETPESCYPCPAGTLIAVRKTTLAEVANLKQAHYVEVLDKDSLTSEQVLDSPQVQQVAQKLRDQLAAPASTQATCTSGALRRVARTALKEGPFNLKFPTVVNLIASSKTSVRRPNARGVGLFGFQHRSTTVFSTVITS